MKAVKLLMQNTNIYRDMDIYCKVKRNSDQKYYEKCLNIFKDIVKVINENRKAINQSIIEKNHQ